MANLKAVEFLAYIPPIQTAIQFGDESARVKFDISPDCRQQAKALVDFQGERLRVLVEVIGDE